MRETKNIKAKLIYSFLIKRRKLWDFIRYLIIERKGDVSELDKMSISEIIELLNNVDEFNTFDYQRTKEGQRYWDNLTYDMFKYVDDFVYIRRGELIYEYLVKEDILDIFLENMKNFNHKEYRRLTKDIERKEDIIQRMKYVTLTYAFNWRQTKQGFLFWNDVYEGMKKHQKTYWDSLLREPKPIILK